MQSFHLKNYDFSGDVTFNRTLASSDKISLSQTDSFALNKDRALSTTVILRHRKENLKKCSLRGLENRGDMCFYTYPRHELPLLADYILLSVGAEELTSNDADKGLLVLDGTWRYAEKMSQYVESRQDFIKRSLPKGWRTAYPRYQDDCIDPEAGLASVEAIFIAYHILGRDTSGLLDGYYWKERFFELNASLL